MGEKGQNPPKSVAQCSCSLLPSPAQSSDSSSQQILPSLHTEHHILRSRISPWPAQVSCPVHAPSCFVSTSWVAEHEELQGPWFGQALLSNTQSTSVLSALFSSQTQHCTCCRNQTDSVPAGTRMAGNRAAETRTLCDSQIGVTSVFLLLNQKAISAFADLA